jgi:Domain of unknown function (DUF4386)
MDSLAGGSPRRLARIAGALYLINILINILGGAYAITIVPAMLVVDGNLAATAHNIQTHELLYRSGLAAHLVVTTTNVPLAVIFYELFKVVNQRLALLDAFFILVATAIEAAGLLNQFTPWSCWAIVPMRARCPPHSSRRWPPCRATWHRSTTPSTRCSSASTFWCSPTWCSTPPSCPEPSASCW